MCVLEYLAIGTIQLFVSYFRKYKNKCRYLEVLGAPSRADLCIFLVLIAQLAVLVHLAAGQAVVCVTYHAHIYLFFSFLIGVHNN